MERIEIPDLYLQERIDLLESENRKKQETLEKQAFLLDHLEHANELLSDQVASLLIENTRLRLGRTHGLADPLPAP